MPFARPTRADLISRTLGSLETRIPGVDARLPRSVVNGIAYTHGGALDGIYGYLDNASKQILVDSCDEATLVRRALILNIPREQPTGSSGNVLATGNAEEIIQNGSILQRADGVQFQVTADTPLGSGTTTSVPVAALGVGATTTTAAGTTLNFVNPIMGVQSTVTVDVNGLGGGADIESIDSLRGRVLNRLQQPPNGGASNDYVTWAKSVAGVTRVWVYPKWLGAGTVGVTFVMDGRATIIPLPADVASVQAAIDDPSARPVTADVTVFAPTAAPISFTIHLNPDSSALRAAVQAQLQSLITAESQPGGTLLLSHIQQAIGNATGTGDYTLSAPTANVAEVAGTISTFGAINWV